MVDWLETGIEPGRAVLRDRRYDSENDYKRLLQNIE